MAVWSIAVFERDEQPTDYFAGTFTCQGGNGLLPIPNPAADVATYNVLTYGGSSGGTIAGQGGSISIA